LNGQMIDYAKKYRKHKRNIKLYNIISVSTKKRILEESENSKY